MLERSRLLLLLWKVLCPDLSPVHLDASYGWSLFLCCIYPQTGLLPRSGNKTLESARYLLMIVTPRKASVSHCNFTKPLGSLTKRLMVHLCRCELEITFDVFYPTHTWKEPTRYEPHAIESSLATSSGLQLGLLVSRLLTSQGLCFDRWSMANSQVNGASYRTLFERVWITSSGSCSPQCVLKSFTWFMCVHNCILGSCASFLLSTTLFILTYLCLLGTRDGVWAGGVTA